MQFSFNAYKHFIGVLLLVLVGLMTNCGNKISHQGDIVFTQLPVTSVSIAQINSLESKYASNMQIAVAKMGEGLQTIDVLTSEFHSSRSPEISYNGLSMIFSAQKDEGDAWQIWSLDLESREFNQVTQSRTNCTDPTWLPNGDIAFSKLVTDDNSLKYHALFTIGIDGCCEQRITFQPHEDINASVMHDGRLLVASQQVYPEIGPFKFLAIRPDGTKSEVFHLAKKSSESIGKAADTGLGNVFFSESSELLTVNFNRPLRTAKSLLDQVLVNSVFAMDASNFLVSVKKPTEKTYGIAIVNTNDPGSESFYYNDSEYHVIEAVVVKERSTPKKLPSRVNTDLSSGFIFSMNADASDIQAVGKTAKVQVLGMNDLLGETSVAEDGSFYLELAADRPVRFQTIDEDGQILRGPSSWMWVRPNERRGCTGCHQDREIAPNNVVPKAMEKAPFAMIR